ncbi:MAG TPA: HypC/HybG/HupF family hydrogenase formation chaperone [Thermoanaerobaculia bacterium]|jgi:hydrogenase expression/formation protein HypC
MCLGAPGQIIEVAGKTALVDFWGTLKSVRLDMLNDVVSAGDYILNHDGCAVRRIPPDQVADTLALYEVILTEAGEDPIAKDVVDELAVDIRELVSA